MHANRKFSDDILPPELILKYFDFSSHATLIDAACGSGYMAKAFAAQSNNAKVYALDIDEVYINYLLEEKLPSNLNPILADISKTTNFEDDSIDLLYISGAYHIFNEEQEKGFDKEVQRILKTEGRLIVVNFKKIPTHFGPQLEIRSSPEELKQKISLKPVELFDISPYFYMYIFQKS